jgi:hypothetical protein
MQISHMHYIIQHQQYYVPLRTHVIFGRIKVLFLDSLHSHSGEGICTFIVPVTVAARCLVQSDLPVRQEGIKSAEIDGKTQLASFNLKNYKYPKYSRSC